MRILPNYFKPLYAVVLINIIGFLLLYFYRKPLENTTIYMGLIVIALICLTYVLIIKMNMGDEYLFLIVSMLISLGVIMLYRLDKELAFKQIVWLTCGIMLFFLSYYAYLKLELWDKLLYCYLGISLVLFLLTFLFGRHIKGANNWIAVGRFSFQPSELIKVLYVLFLASYRNDPDKLRIDNIRLKGIKLNASSQLIFMAISYCFMAFLALQREFGTALLLFAVYYTFLYVMGSKVPVMLANGAFALVGGWLGYFLCYHKRIRVEVWLNPWKDIANKGYQITQSLFAIGAGGFFGTGLGLGHPDFIPEVHTDFIFSAICEEMGIFGGMAVILLFFIFAYRGFKVSLTVKQPFDKTVALGIAMMFAFQTFIILGGVIKFIPMTGITLPFISYGGSSLTTGFISLGILQAISKKSL